MSERPNRGLAAVWASRRRWAWLLWPLSVLFGSLVVLRRRLYRLGLRQSLAVPVPVLVIGNVLAGGVGKTPVVLMLVRHFQQRGMAVGVVSRGYGRTSKGCQEVLKNTPPDQSGDEPALIKRATGAPVFVAARRVEAATALLAKYPKTALIVSDDGLQHYALQRDIEVCVFDDRGVANDFLLPAGPLREPWPRKALKIKTRAAPISFVLHSGNDEALADRLFSQANSLAGQNQRGFRAKRMLADFALSKDGIRIELAQLAGQANVAVAAIGQPEAFFAMLRNQGVALQETIALPDHFDFAQWKFPFDQNHNLLCTEKDAVKLWRLYPDALAVPLILKADDRFFSALDEALAEVAGQTTSRA
jgi:tetraacyldisaccharide 4'-kinase